MNLTSQANTLKLESTNDSIQMIMKLKNEGQKQEDIMFPDPLPSFYTIQESVESRLCPSCVIRLRKSSNSRRKHFFCRRKKITENIPNIEEIRYDQRKCKKCCTDDTSNPRNSGKNKTRKEKKKNSVILDAEVTLAYPSKFTYHGCYNGQGLPHGPNGIMKWSNGDVYEGNFWNGMQDGLGTFYFSDGSEYVGKWECNMMHGEGTRRFINGSVYSGPYNRGKRKGKNGHFYFSNGDAYVGEFDYDQFEGKGIFYYGNGIVYEGGFANGKRNGEGIFYQLNNETDISCYILDRPVGNGVRWNENRSKAWRLRDGEIVDQINHKEGLKIMKEIKIMDR